MPMYEGIGLISEKHAVVLDIGTAYTKVGYAGKSLNLWPDNVLRFFSVCKNTIEFALFNFYKAKIGRVLKV